jgi:hypothetical protein
MAAGCKRHLAMLILFSYFFLISFKGKKENENITGLWKSSVILLYLRILQTDQMDLLYTVGYNTGLYRKSGISIISTMYYDPLFSYQLTF